MREGEFPEGRWRARWIWFEAPRIRRSSPRAWAASVEPADRIGCLRTSFQLDSLPARAPARATADSRYVLFVNGAEVARGPVRSNPRRLHYDAFDLAPLLRRGRNAIAALVRYYGRPTPWWAPIPPALQLGAGAFVFEARLGPDEWLVSDARWRAHANEAWEAVAGRGTSNMPLEAFDARRLAPDWCAPDFDDARWEPALALAANSIGFTGHHEPPSHPYGPLLERPIGPLGGALYRARAIALHSAPAGELAPDPVEQVRRDLAPARPDASAATGGESLALDASAAGVSIATFDFGQVVAGTLRLELDAPAGARVDVAASEQLGAHGSIAQEDEHVGLRYVARGSDDRFESFDALGCRYLALAVRAPGPVRVRAVAVQERLHPRGEERPFECSDPRLSKIWAVGRRTVDLNSHDAYLDCPTREQRAWTGDFVVHQMVDLATNADWRLPRWNVELLASPRADGMLPMAGAGDIEHQDFVHIPDWALHWVHGLHNLYRYTGDRELVARLLPVAEGVVRWFAPFRGSDGLLADVTGWVIVDWSSVSVDGRSSVLNALWGRALAELAEMSDWLGDAGRARRARQDREALAAGFERFWEARRGLYVDHLSGAAGVHPASQHAQSAALVAGLVPHERVGRLVDVLTDRARWVHATWSRARGDSRRPGPGESGLAGPYLVLGPPPPWWDVERGLVVAQPFFRYVVHDALAAAGRADLIESMCLDWTELLARCDTSWSETWYGGTTCHGWCSTPTRDLVVYTLGIQPIEPGFSRASIAPRLGRLEWARGAAPTPHGWISVDADAEWARVESPVPFDFSPPKGAPTRHPPGRHELRLAP